MKKVIIVTVCLMGWAALAVDQNTTAGGTPARMERHSGIGMRAMEGDIPMMPLTQMFGNKELGLTKEQIQQLKDIAAGSTNEMKVLQAKMQDLARHQADLMGQDLPNEEAVLKGADEISSIRAEIGRIRMKQMLAAQKILTPEQRQKMREKMKAHMEQRRGGDRMKSKGHGRTGEGQEAPTPAGQEPVKTPEAKTE